MKHQINCLGKGRGSRHYRVLLLAVCACFFSSQAAETCTPRAPKEVFFPNIVPWSDKESTVSSVIKVKCVNTDSGWNRQFSYCLSLGAGTAGDTVGSRKLTRDGVVGAEAIALTINSNGSQFGSYNAGTGTKGISVNRRVFRYSYDDSIVPVNFTISGWSAATKAGVYKTSFPPAQASFAQEASTGYWDVLNCTVSTPDLSKSFPFDVSVTVPDYCEISANPGGLAFHEQRGALSRRMVAQTSMKLRCTADTAYSIGLESLSEKHAGFGVMKSTSHSGDEAHEVPYVLFKDRQAMALPWGNKESDRYRGIGTGEVQTIHIYGAISSPETITPGTYEDRVMVLISY